MPKSRPNTEGLPDGILDSADLFFVAMAERAAASPQQIDEAIEVMEGEFKKAMRAIGLDPDERRNRMSYYTGAYLGLRVASRRFKIYLKQKNFEAGKPIEGSNV